MTYRHTSQPDTSAILANPGPLIANIPAILGFYPQESLLMIGLDRLLAGSGRYALGPVLRIDLDDDCALSALIDMATTPGSPLDCDLIFIIIVSADLDRADAVAEELYVVSDDRDLPVAACWHVPEVMAGEAYSMVFGPPSPSGPGPSPQPDPWLEGRLPEIVATASMEPWHRAGALPEPTREDAVDRLRSRNRQLADAVALQESVERVVDPIPSRPGHRDDHRLLAVALAAGRAVGRVEAVGAGAGEPTALTDAAERDTGLLLTVGVALAHVRARDLSLHTLADAGHACAPVLLAVARTFTGIVRANALCAYAIVQARRQLPMMAQHALMVSAEEFPGHVLTRCLLEAGMIGRLAEITESAVEESRRLAGQVAAECDGCDVRTDGGRG